MNEAVSKQSDQIVLLRFAEPFERMFSQDLGFWGSLALGTFVLLFGAFYIAWKHRSGWARMRWWSFPATVVRIGVWVVLWSTIYATAFNGPSAGAAFAGWGALLLVVGIDYFIWAHRRDAETIGSWALPFTLFRVGMWLLLMIVFTVGFAVPELSTFTWVGLMGCVLLLAADYVFWMYVRDMRSVHPLIALPLAFLRGCVFLLLAGVFLLPATQRWQETTYHSRVVVLTDVSSSMIETRDVPPSEDAPPPETVPTRSDLLINFLEKDQVAFVPKLVEKNPVFMYRFGSFLDENFHVFTPDGHYTRRAWEQLGKPVGDAEKAAAEAEGDPLEATDFGRDKLREFLKPNPRANRPDEPDEEKRKRLLARLGMEERLISGTNVNESVMTVIKRETNNKVQGIIVFSDGHSNEGTIRTLQDIRARVTDKNSLMPIFVVAIGEDRPQVKLEITDVRGPDQARPENDIPIKVEINGLGLADQPVEVFLDIYKPGNDPKKQDAKPDQTIKPKTPTVKFNTSRPPHATAEFEVKPSLFAGEDKPGVKPEFPEGDYWFVPRVPRDKRESFIEKFHTHEPMLVRVVKRPLRVLLFASAATRDYQFAQTLFAREASKQRIDLAIYLQPPPGEKEPRKNVVQNVDPKRLLKKFPTRLTAREGDKGGGDQPEETKLEEELDNLANYDVIVAFDPDWNQLDEQQIKNVETWVENQGGGLILVGGAVNTIELAKPRRPDDVTQMKLAPIINLYPVILEDPRTPKPGAPQDRKTDQPWRLNFPGALPDMEFLRLDEENPDRPQLSGWGDFFGDTAETKAGSAPKRGFYNFYPVKRERKGATVVATFTDLAGRLEDGSEQPYIVTMNVKTGRTVWLGSGEMWRLREYNENFLERFWTKLNRYAAAGGSNRVNKRLIVVMGKSFRVNDDIQLEAQIFGRDLKPLPETSRPKVLFKKWPDGVKESDLPTPSFTLEPKTDLATWNGFFKVAGDGFRAPFVGDYELLIEAEENEPATAKFSVRPSNPETDETRPDYQALYDLASEASDIRLRFDDNKAGWDELEKALRQARPVPSTFAEVKAEVGPDGVAQPVVSRSDEPRLYFTLETAHLIPSCMQAVEETVRNRGGEPMPLWNWGPELLSPELFHIVLALVNVSLILASGVIVILALTRIGSGRAWETLGSLVFTLVPLALFLPMQVIFWDLAAPLFGGPPVQEPPITTLRSVLLLTNVFLIVLTVAIAVLSVIRIPAGKFKETAYYIVFPLILLLVLLPLQWLFWDGSSSLAFLDHPMMGTPWGDMPLYNGYWPGIYKNPILPLVLAVAVVLLGLEWFTRKMSRLA